MKISYRYTPPKPPRHYVTLRSDKLEEWIFEARPRDRLASPVTTQIKAYPGASYKSYCFHNHYDFMITFATQDDANEFMAWFTLTYG